MKFGQQKSYSYPFDNLTLPCSERLVAKAEKFAEGHCESQLIQMLMPQKKVRMIKKSQSSHSRLQSRSQNSIKYGPPPAKKLKICEILGHNSKNYPMGLKRHMRYGSCFAGEEDKQSYFDLALRTGELNFFKRFKSVRYLQTFSSKKNMYNLCQEKTISKLHSQVFDLNRQRNLLKTRKRSHIKF